MSELRQGFEKAFPIPAHWIEFDEKRNKYYCPYVADAKAQEYQAKWEVWQSRQSEINHLNAEKAELEKRVDGAIKDLIRPCYTQVGRIEDALKALRGGHE